MRRFALLAAMLVVVLPVTAIPGDDVPEAPRATAATEPLAIGERLPAGLSVTPLAPGAEDVETPLASLVGDPGRPLVVLFWSARCPVCRRYAAALKALARDYDGRARIVAVFPNATETESEARKWLDAEGVACGAAFDRRRDAAARLGAVVTPTALVVDAAGTLRYRGPIDDDRRARRRDTTDHLRVAIESVLAGRAVENPEPRAFGSAVRDRRR